MYFNCHSYFSLLYGTYSPEELIKHAKSLNINKIALTDINSVVGFYEVYKEGLENGIEVIPGVEFRNNNDFKYIAVAKNEKGFFEINHFLSQHLIQDIDFPDVSPEFENVSIIYSIENYPSELKPYECVGIKPWELNKLYKSKIPENKRAAWIPVTFENKIKFNLHKLLRSISENTLLSKLNFQAHPDEKFSNQPFNDYPEYIKNAENILSECSYSITFKTSKNKSTFLSKEEDETLLRKLGEEGLRFRYKEITSHIRARFESEMDTIKKLDFFAYYLITWDIIRYAKSQGFHHVGRGSGANSLVAYCIGITDVDPIELDLYFERFINLHRTSPPDFDIDFSWDERNQIIQYVFDKYGFEHVALLATVTTFQGRSAYRELGKVFGLPKSEIEDILDNPSLQFKNEHTKYVFQYAPLMKDFPVNLSIHAGGIIISETPLFQYTALQPMPKGFPVVQFDMYSAEDIGYAKFDILSQRGLGHIKSCIDLVKQNNGIEIDIHQVDDFKKDPKVRQQLVNHETMGCFYIESPAMRQLIWKLQCDNYLTLVAASSIIRPGVASSGMMSQYIKNHHSPEKVTYLHPKMEELMKETYGIMVYQEDVIKVAHHFAGLDLAEADVLRRGMSGKSRSKKEFQIIAEKWFKNCKENGYSDELSKEVWRQTESFSGYSFSKAHSASYAVESYQSLFLKTYYPLEFMVGVINNFGGFYDTDLYFKEAQRYGAKVEAVDINQSLYLTSITQATIWLGFIHIKSLEQKLIQKIIENRATEGAFTSFYEFYQRIQPGIEQLSILIKADAFRCFQRDKKELYWDAYFYIQNLKKEKTGLFELEIPKFKLPNLQTTYLEKQYDEIELLGYTIGSPFEMMDEEINSKISATHFPLLLGKTVVIYGYLANYKLIRTKNKKIMAFGYFLDQDFEFFDTTLFPQTLEKYPFTGKGVYKMEGKIVEEYGFYSIEINRMRKCGLKPDPRV